jgi:hypothetical protein
MKLSNIIINNQLSKCVIGEMMVIKDKLVGMLMYAMSTDFTMEVWSPRLVVATLSPILLYMF